MERKIKQYIKTWEQRCYVNGIPDEIEPRMEELNIAPSYKAICISILKNDHQLKRLGFTPQKTNSYHELKRIELGIKSKQLKLDL